MSASEVYLELSTSGDATGQKVGKLPRSVPLNDLRDLGHPESPIKAIRAKCVECSGGRELSRLGRGRPSRNADSEKQSESIQQSERGRSLSNDRRPS
jgi:hypothetical protein